MHNYDLIATYFPALDDIPAAKLQSTRERLRLLVSAAHPDLDVRAGSPFGDLHLNPLAELVAAVEIAMNKVLSDFDMEQVANGIVHNCDWVKKYLRNLAIVERVALQATGIVRLTFRITPAPTVAIVLDRRLRFRFNQSVFQMRLPHAGSMELLPPNTPPTAGYNQRVMADYGDHTYVVDIPLEGTMEAVVEAGAQAELDMTVPGLSGATALYQFDTGTPPESVSTLAERSRKTIYAATMNTRGGVSRFLNKEFPDLDAVSSVMASDAELKRDTFNALGFAAGGLDIHVKSRGWLQDEEMPVQLRWYPADEEFRGKLTLPFPPAWFKSVKWAGNRDVVLEPVIYSRSSDPLFTSESAAFSTKEEFWIRIPMPDGDPVTVSGSPPAATFLIRCIGDPMVRVVSDFVDSPDSRPVGVTPLVRGFYPVRLDTFTVTFLRERGRTVEVEQAREEIWAYMKSLGYPGLFSLAKVADAMYYAGAQDVPDITVDGEVRFSSADMFIPSDSPDPSTDWTGALALAEAVPTHAVSSLADMLPVHDETTAACGARNICWLLEKETIKFTEIVR